MEILKLRVNCGQSKLSDIDREYIAQNYSILDKSEINWIKSVVRDCKLNFELGFEENSISYFVTKNWQVIANNSDRKLIARTFYEVINALNGNRKQENPNLGVLKDIKIKSLTKKLENTGRLEKNGLTKYQKIMIMLIGFGTLAGIVLGYLQWITSN